MKDTGKWYRKNRIFVRAYFDVLLSVSFNLVRKLTDEKERESLLIK